MTVAIRPATRADVATVLRFVRELAARDHSVRAVGQGRWTVQRVDGDAPARVAGMN